jgi:hypothetical protein
MNLRRCPLTKRSQNRQIILVNRNYPIKYFTIQITITNFQHESWQLPRSLGRSNCQKMTDHMPDVLEKTPPIRIERT